MANAWFFVCGAAGVFVLLGTPATVAAQPDSQVRQILVLQSMDRGSLVFDSFTAELRASLQERAGAQITIFEFVVVPAGLSQAPEGPAIEFLKSIYAGRGSPELVVTVGGPAAAFVRSNREQLFPQTPVVFAAVEARFLNGSPPGANETAVPVSIDYTRLVGDILQLVPDTRHVFMLTGSGPLSAFWRAELQRNFASYRNRLTFIWSHDLSYEEMLERAATLPPNSAIFYISAGTFATGSWQGEERTFADLSARANAPVFGAQSVWLGSGIVGGHLLDIQDLGATTADVVMRILNGERAGGIRIPARSLGHAVFDARQLGRWSISEARLPAGSDVRFRAPSLWRDYRREAVAAVAVLSVQALLIAGLLYQRRARRRAEIENRRNLSLAADANRRMTMTALTGSIAHELSQPLSSILHNVQAGELLMRSNRATPEMLREILADIRTADVRATEIIDRHRTMLRAHELDAKPIDIHTIVRESVALIANDTAKRQVHMHLDLPSAPCIVTGDRVLLQQVLVNLMVNAMDAMSDTPASERRITVRTDVAPPSVKVAVQDAGTGLPPALNGKLFEPFMTTKAHGTGIGLAIARTIVDAHGGTIDAHDNETGGATFTVTLPLARRDALA